ncbi:uracil-DNA glycosylase [Halobacteriales archaeon QS_1_68_17]|nr:MAG: uracil-DNA glycosylase [Halobacteriales archaeon QS_1_68_17]
MENVTDRRSNPFDMRPPCERFVPGYGDANAHFHVIGDHPGVHGGADSGLPFTDSRAGERLQRALVAGGLLERAGRPPTVDRTFLSYLHACVHEGNDGNGDPTDDDYARLEPFFDAELRAITAHVLLPVGERAVGHVVANYTAREMPADLDAVHATEMLGAGFLVVPLLDPAEWTDDHEDRVGEALASLRETDYRREADLGRFLADGETYYVR